MPRPTRRWATNKSIPNSSGPTKRKNTKITGERSEAAFLTRAVQLNFGIAKLWGTAAAMTSSSTTESAFTAFKSNAPNPSALAPTKPAPPTPPAKDAPPIPRRTSTLSPLTSFLSTSSISSRSKSAPRRPCFVSILTARPRRCASNPTAKPGTWFSRSNRTKEWKSKPARMSLHMPIKLVSAQPMWGQPPSAVRRAKLGESHLPPTHASI